MNTSDIIDKLHRQLPNYSNAQIKNFVEMFFDTLTENIIDGNRIELRGFGIFSVRDYESYVGRNPKTGEKITVPEKRLPFWRTSSLLAERIDKL